MYSNIVGLVFVDETKPKILRRFANMQRINAAYLQSIAVVLVHRLIQKINFNVVTDHFFQKTEKNKFHSTRILVKKTGKIEMHFNEKNGEKMCSYFHRLNRPIYEKRYV